MADHRRGHDQPADQGQGIDLLTEEHIDVRTGQWETYAPEPFEDTSFSNDLNREASDQEQVLLLKEKGYQALADGLAAKYGG